MRRKLALFLMLLAPATASSCVSNKKKAEKNVQAAEQQLSVDEAPKDMTKLGANFANKVTLLGYETDVKGPVKPGQRVNYTLYWRADKEVDSKGWRLFTHVLDGKRRKVLNIDSVGPLREADLRPANWKPGKIYADKQSFKVPKKVNGDRLNVVTGVWKGNDRFPIVSGPSLGDNRALALSVEIQGARSTKKEVPQLRLDRLKAPVAIKIDGKLDEPAWKSAPTTGPFQDVNKGGKNDKSPVQGSAKLLWDDSGLYVAFVVEDKDLVGGFEKGSKDPHLWTKDAVEIMIDPDGDGDNKDYYEIQINPQNLVFDSHFESYNKPRGGKDGPFGNEQWSSQVTSAVVLDGTLDKPGDKDKGYTVEAKIPWSAFHKAKQVPPKVGQTWRMNFYAMQNNSGVAWSPILREGNFHKASRFGRILFAEEGWEPPKSVAKQDHADKEGKVTAAKAGKQEAAKDESGSGAVRPAKASRPNPPAAPKPSSAAAPAPAPKPASKAASPQPVNKAPPPTQPANKPAAPAAP